MIAGGERAEVRAFARNLIRRQSGRKEAQRFARLHSVDRLTKRFLRHDAVDLRRDETDAVRPGLEERPQVLLAPGVIDNHQDEAVAKRLAELSRGGVDRLQARPLARQRLDLVGEDGQKALRLLAELEDAPIYRLEIEPAPGNSLQRVSQIMIEKVLAMPKRKIGQVIGRLSPDQVVALNSMLSAVIG
jgi:PemK-like, MazF-like toxin of type II toxin-antitoxin system